MAVVIQNATKGIIFGIDGGRGKWRILNLETHYLTKPFDVKVLDKGGIDIVASGRPFISDIIFNDTTDKDKLSQNYYNIEENHENYKRLVTHAIHVDYGGRLTPSSYLRRDEMFVIDYEDPVNWALTYKMRGFKDVQPKPYPRSHPMMNSYTASGLLNAIKKIQRGEHIKLKATVNVDRRHMSIFKNNLHFNGMCLYVEYEFTIPTELEARERIIDIEVPERSKIIDFYNEGSLYGTMIKISMSPRITDYLMHSDEGYYDAKVNYYSKKQGIVLLGEQNVDVMFYGNALENNIYIPDVLYEVHSQ